jgi:hypothetical protein
MLNVTQEASFTNGIAADGFLGHNITIRISSQDLGIGVIRTCLNFRDKTSVKELADMRHYTAAIPAVWVDCAIKVYEDMSVCCAAGAVN